MDMRNKGLGNSGLHYYFKGNRYYDFGRIEKNQCWEMWSEKASRWYQIKRKDLVKELNKLKALREL